MFKKLSRQFVKDPVFYLTFAFIFVLAIFFRFYNYFNRVYIYSDHALFVQAAKYAFDNHLIPQIGPFAQAPFFTGPWWLWILEIFYIFPFGLLTPWYLMSLVSLLFVYLIYQLGNKIGGRRVGFFAALLAAVSTAQVDNSFSVWNAAADPFLALLAYLLLVRFFETKRAIFAFFLGFVVSMAITIHFQMVLLLPVCFVAVVTSRPKIGNLAAMALGFFIPLLPFLYFDLRFEWFETRRIYDYVTIAQYRIYVPNRWLTYAGVYWPQTWASVVGGSKFIGGLLIISLSVLALLKLKSWKKYQNFFLVAGAFALSVLMFRYYRGERFFYYSHFSHPAVIVLSAWVLAEVYRFKKVLGLVLLAAVLFFTARQTIDNFKARGITLLQINSLKKEIYAKYPTGKFDIYGCIYNGALVSHPLSYSMYFDGRNGMDGVKIGVCQLVDRSITWSEIGEADVTGDSSAWLNESTENVYKTMTEWWKIKRPKFYD
ncbi:MAG: glycosyltransferase family 39 protein [Candidatus Curtissbacteria bacterium]|nr:glycosyltransferase family 39 protein [Candidatus Curtissbacteria bacterium]